MEREIFNEYYPTIREISKILFGTEYSTISVYGISFEVNIKKDKSSYKLFLRPSKSTKFITIYTIKELALYEKKELSTITYDDWFNLSTLHNIAYSHQSLMKLLDFKHNFNLLIREVQYESF